ncbi:MAG: DsbA family protein [Alphaproteobacteria bacterium]|nr:DsbA family protein [Alphaproteobacteria bacterium]
MKFENTIKKLSAFVASFFLFFLCAGMYLQIKGFIMTPDGKIVLVNPAQAQQTAENETSVPVPGEISTKVDPQVNIILPKGHILGQENAPITIYEYSSFGCFHCADFHLDTLPQLEKDFINTGKVKLVFASFPLDKKSMQAAMLSECIPQENYHAFLNTVFKNQREWGLSLRSDKILSEYASLNGITKEKALECMKDDKIAKEIVEGRQEAIDKLKIQGTPAFLIISDEGKEVIHGAPSYQALKALLEKRLKN